MTQVALLKDHGARGGKLGMIDKILLKDYRARSYDGENCIVKRTWSTK